MGVSVIDILVLGALGYAGWRGFNKGAIIEAFSFATLIVGIYLASRFSDITASALSIRANGKDFSYVPVMLFSLLFGGLIYGAIYIKSAVGRQLESVDNPQPSKIMGSVFGTLHMFLVVGVIVVMLRAADYNFKVIPDREKEYSLLFNPVVSVMTGLFPALDYVGEVDEKKTTENNENSDPEKNVVDQ
ncbi:MAG: hypothetical protein RIS47_1047 [Bacteroidota bacterium]